MIRTPTVLLLAFLTSALSACCSVGQMTPPAEAVRPEVRGTWLTTTANDAISTPEKTAATMKRLREIGLNVVYIECWKDGYTEFPSATMDKLIGVPFKVNAAPAAQQRDLLLEGSIEAHRNGMLAIGWFEYGFMAAYKTTNNELRTLGEKEGWILHDQHGQSVSKQDSFVWLNPLHPKAQEIVLNVVLDAVKKYDLDGVQLDDRISMPTNMGYDDFTRKLYAEEHNGAQPPTDVKDAAWLKWRADKITAFAKRFAAEVHKVNPNVIVSVSPAPYPWCYENFACDWPTWTHWSDNERWDEYVPQNYRFNFERTKASIEEAFGFIGDRRKDLIAGIRVVGDGPDMPEKDLLDSIRFARDAGLAGHVLWYSRGVLDIFPEQLKAFYNVAQVGQATHPARPADWRSLPIVATKATDGSWHYSVEKGQAYRTIAKVRGRWVDLGAAEVPAGLGTLSKPEAEAVELLPDHKP